MILEAALRLHGERIEQLHRASGPCHDLSHVLRVAQMAEHLATVEGVDVEACVLAALFHDVGHGTGRADHHTESALIARAEITELSEERLTDVLSAIAERRFRFLADERTSAVGLVLDDADNLDALGHIGFSRAFLWIGEHGWTLPSVAAGPDAVAAANHGALRWHWDEKLRALEGAMHTATGRAIARRRATALAACLDGLGRELADPTS